MRVRVLVRPVLVLVRLVQVLVRLVQVRRVLRVVMMCVAIDPSLYDYSIFTFMHKQQGPKEPTHCPRDDVMPLIETRRVQSTTLHTRLLDEQPYPSGLGGILP